MHVKKAEKARQRTYEVERAGSCLGWWSVMRQATPVGEDTAGRRYSYFLEWGAEGEGEPMGGRGARMRRAWPGEGEGAGQWARPMAVTCMTRLGVADGGGGGGGGHVFVVVVLMLVRGAVEESGMHGCTKRPAVLPTPRSCSHTTRRITQILYSSSTMWCLSSWISM